MKYKAFYKCRWCQGVFSYSVPENHRNNPVGLTMQHSMVTTHKCDDIRTGIADLIGVKTENLND